MLLPNLALSRFKVADLLSNIVSFLNIFLYTLHLVSYFAITSSFWSNCLLNSLSSLLRTFPWNKVLVILISFTRKHKFYALEKFLH